MRAAWFIANKLSFSQGHSFTKTIIRIAIASIALSLIVMILASCTIEGFSRVIHGKVFGFWGNIHITHSAAGKNFELKTIDISNPFYQKVRTLDKISYLQINDDTDEEKYVQTKGGVKTAYPFIVSPSLIETKDALKAVLIKGVDKDYDWQNLSTYLIKGKVPQKRALDKEVIVSKQIAASLRLDVGDAIILSFIKDRERLRRKVRVIGIYNTGLEEYDRRFIIGDMSMLQEVLGWEPNIVAGVEVVLDHPEDSKIIADYLYENTIPMELYAEPIEEKFPNIFEWLKLQDINETVIYQLMIMVAIINMITVILILVLERIKMIGLLKALGANNLLLKQVFLINAMRLILWGLIIGNMVGIGIALAQKRFGFVKLDEQSYYLDTAPIYFDWTKILIINLGAAIVILIALIIPVSIISTIKPVKALRFD